MLARAPGAGLGDLPGDCGSAIGIEAAGLGDDVAVPGHDVPRGSTGDQTDVGGRLLVEATQIHAGDRRRRSCNRAVPVVGFDSGMSLDPDEIGTDLLLGRRRDDHLPDPPGVVEDEATIGAQLAHIKRLGTAQALLLGDGQQQLDPDRRRLGSVPRDQLHEYCDGRLVIGTEDGLPTTAEDPFVFDHLDLARVRHGVDVGAEHRPAVGAARQPRDDVPGACFRRPGSVVLAHIQPQRPQLGEDRVGDLALLPGRAADLAEPDKGLMKPVHGGTG